MTKRLLRSSKSSLLPELNECRLKKKLKAEVHSYSNEVCDFVKVEIHRSAYTSQDEVLKEDLTSETISKTRHYIRKHQRSSLQEIYKFLKYGSLTLTPLSESSWLWTRHRCHSTDILVIFNCTHMKREMNAVLQTHCAASISNLIIEYANSFLVELLWDEYESYNALLREIITDAKRSMEFIGFLVELPSVCYLLFNVYQSRFNDHRNWFEEIDEFCVGNSIYSINLLTHFFSIFTKHKYTFVNNAILSILHEKCPLTMF